MSDRTEVAKEFAKILLDTMLLVASLLALYGAVVFALFTWFDVSIAYSLLIGSVAVVGFTSIAAGLHGIYHTAKFRVELRKAKSK